LWLDKKSLKHPQPLRLLPGFSGSEVGAGRLFGSAEALPDNEIDEADADEYLEENPGPKTSVCTLCPSNIHCSLSEYHLVPKPFNQNVTVTQHMRHFVRAAGLGFWPPRQS
jgi:hypothetical protein